MIPTLHPTAMPIIAAVESSSSDDAGVGLRLASGRSNSNQPNLKPLTLVLVTLEPV